MTDHLAKANELKDRAEQYIEQGKLRDALWILRDAADHALIAHDMIDVKADLPKPGQKALCWVDGHVKDFVVIEHIEGGLWDDDNSELVTLWQALPLTHKRHEQT